MPPTHEPEGMNIKVIRVTDSSQIPELPDKDVPIPPGAVVEYTYWVDAEAFKDRTDEEIIAEMTPRYLASIKDETE